MSPCLFHFAETLHPIQPLRLIPLEPGIVMQKSPRDGEVWNSFPLAAKKNQAFTDFFLSVAFVVATLKLRQLQQLQLSLQCLIDASEITKHLRCRPSCDSDLDLVPG